MCIKALFNTYKYVTHRYLILHIVTAINISIMYNVKKFADMSIIIYLLYHH